MIAFIGVVFALVAAVLALWLASVALALVRLFWGEQIRQAVRSRLDAWFDGGAR